MWNQRVQVIANNPQHTTTYENLVVQAGFEKSRSLQPSQAIPDRIHLQLDAVLVVFPLKGAQRTLFDSLLSLRQRPVILIVVAEPSGQRDEQEALQQADDFLYSPFSTEELLLRLCKLVRSDKPVLSSNAGLQQSLLKNKAAPSSPLSIQDMIAEAANEAAMHLKEISNPNAVEADWISFHDNDFDVDYEQASHALFHSDDDFKAPSVLDLERSPEKSPTDLQNTQAIPHLREVNVEELLPLNETTPLRGNGTDPAQASYSESTDEERPVSASLSASFDSVEASGGALPRIELEPSHLESVDDIASAEVVLSPPQTGQTLDTLAPARPPVHFRESTEVPYEVASEEQDESLNTYLDVRAIDSAELLSAYRDPQFSQGAIVAKTTLSYENYVEPTEPLELKPSSPALNKRHTLEYESDSLEVSTKDADTDHELKQVKKPHRTDVDTPGIPPSLASTAVVERRTTPILSTIEPAPSSTPVSTPPPRPALRVPSPQPLRTGTRPSTPAMTEALLEQKGDWFTPKTPISGETPPIETPGTSNPFVPKEATTAPPSPSTGEVKRPTPTVIPAPSSSTPSSRPISQEEDAWLQEGEKYGPSDTNTDLDGSMESFNSLDMPGYPSRFSPLRSPLLFSIVLGLLLALVVYGGLRQWKYGSNKTANKKTPTNRRVVAKKTPTRMQPRPRTRRSVMPPPITPRVRPMDLRKVTPRKTTPTPRRVAVAPRGRQVARRIPITRPEPAVRRRVQARIVRRPPPRRRIRKPRRVALRRRRPVQRRVVKAGGSVRGLLRQARRLMRRGGKSNFRRAKRLLLTARQRSPKSLAVLVNLGKVEYELENTSTAIRYLRQAARRSARATGDGLVTLGAIYYEKKRISLARRYYSLYLRYYPRSRTASEVRYILKTLK